MESLIGLLGVFEVSLKGTVADGVFISCGVWSPTMACTLFGSSAKGTLKSPVHPPKHATNKQANRLIEVSLGELLSPLTAPTVS